MQFLSPWMLWGLAALAAPILIHLWKRRRVIEIPFSTLKYLRAAVARTSRSARLENLLLLFLRCVIFALLVLAAARPAVPKKSLHQVGGNVQRTVILIVDDSLSMSYRIGDRSRLDAAREQARRVLDALMPGDEAAVFAVSDLAQPLVAQPTLDRPVLRHAIEGAQPCLGSTNFAPALVAARKLLAASAKPVHEIYLFTDNQAGGWRFDPAVVFNDAWKKADISLVIVQPDDAAAINAAVAAVKISSPLVTEGARVNGVVTVANFSAAPLHDLLQIRMADATLVNVPVDAGAGAVADVPFEFQMPPVNAGEHTARGEARLQGDNLPADDHFFFTVPIHQTPKVAIFEGQSAGPERARSGFYLRRVLAAGEAATDTVSVFPHTALEETPLTPYSAVFLADVPRLSDRAAAELDQFAKAGGTIVLFPGDATDVPAFTHLDFLPASAIRMRELPAGRLSSQILDPGNPLFANTWGPDTPFPPLPQSKLIEWEGKPGMQVLVMAGGTEGFVMARDDGAGKVFIVNASPDRAWGDFPLSPAFLPLVQQIALQSSEHGRTEPPLTVGQPIPASPALPAGQPVNLTFPDGSTQSVPAGEKTFLLDHAAQAGFYTVGASTDAAARLTFAVNVDTRESDLTPIAENALMRITPHETVAGPDNLRAWLTRSRGMVPLWPWLLLALAALFAVEHAVSNLAARHRAQGGETHIKTGRLNRRRVGRPFRAPKEEADAHA